MNLYSIEQLKSATSEQLKQWSQERIETFIQMLGKAIEGKQVKAFYNNADSSEVTLTIDRIEYATQTKGSYRINYSDKQFFPINVYLKEYNKTFKNKYRSLYQEGGIHSSLNYLIEQSMDKETDQQNKTYTFFGYKKDQGENFIQLDIYYPSKWFSPDFIALYETQDNKKSLEEIEKKLAQHIKEIGLRRFNMIEKNHNYITESLESVFEMIAAAQKRFDKDTLAEIIKSYPDNKEVLIKAMYPFYHDIFEFSSEKLKNDRDFLYEQVIQKGNVHLLEFAAQHIKDEFILEAIKIDGYALKYASDELKSNKEVCLLSLKTNSFGIDFMSDELKEDIDVLYLTAKGAPMLLIGNSELAKNKELLMIALSNIHKEQSGNLLSKVIDKLKDDHEVALVALEKDENNIQFLSPRLKKELEGNNPFIYLKNIDLNINLDKTMVNTKKDQPKKKL